MQGLPCKLPRSSAASGLFYPATSHALTHDVRAMLAHALARARKRVLTTT